MAVIENDVIKVTVSNSNTRNVIQVSPGVSALSSVSLSLNDLNNVNTSGITNGQTIVYDNGSFVAGDSGAVETINGEAPDSNGDVTIDFSVDGLTDVDVTSPSVGDILKYETNRWVNDSLGKSDVGLANVDNTSDADKPISTATQTALDVKANTSSVPASLTDLSDVSIVGTPSGNQALIYDATAGAFKSQVSYTNRFEDEVENGKQMPTIFAERAYSVKAEGDGVFIDPESDTPAAGKVIVRKIYHKTGFITDADVIGDYTLIHTFADDTAYADTVATFEGFEDGATYGVPPFTLLQTWEEVTAAPSFTGLLNETYGSGAEAAYSTRRLNGNVTECMVIRRASGTPATTTIGFDSNGNIDEAAITTFCTGTTCTVETWKDQSGNGNDATQSTPANQPTIYTGGALVKEQGRVALQGTSTSKLPLSSTVTLSNEASIFTLCTTKATDNPWGGDSSGTGQLTWVYFSNVNTNWRLINNSGVASYTVPFTVEGTRLLQTHNRNSSNSIPLTLNGTLANTKSLSGDIPVSVVMGGNWFNYAGIGQEMIFYNSEKSASDQTSIESNVGDYFTQNTPLLDTYTGAAACYSLRLMRTAYTGNAVTVRRASNNDTQGIGFNVFGELDTVSLAAFCGSSDGFVDTWHDQSSNGNDATQGATNNQPKIYDSVTGVVTENGKPAVEFDGSDDELLPPQFLDSVASNPKKYVTSVFAKGAATNVRQPYDFQYNPSVYDNIASLTIQGSTNEVVVKDYNKADNPTSQSSSAVMTQTQNLISHSYDLTAGARVQNGYLNGTLMTGTATGYASGSSNKISNSYSFIANFDGKMQEIVAWNSDQTDNRTNIEDNINTFYSIY